MERIKTFYGRYEHYLSPAAFLAGFVVDNFTLTRIDLLFDNLILFGYLAFATVSVVALNFFGRKEQETGFGIYATELLPLAAQFAFGGLFSGYAVFYIRSASLGTSWPFFLLLLFVIVGNEIFRKRFERLGFQIGMLFFSIFSFAIFFVPVLLGEIGPAIFLISGGASIILIFTIILLLSFVVPGTVYTGRKIIFGTIGGIFIVLNIFYFLNIIPPIPLALKESGIYHTLTKTPEGSYYVSYEKESWIKLLKNRGVTFHYAPGESIYVYTAIFAPTKLDATISHIWEYYDEEKKTWTTVNKVQFPITGGRESGYRGYSLKISVPEGRYRVRVTNEFGQILGSVPFTVVYADAPVKLEYGVK